MLAMIAAALSMTTAIEAGAAADPLRAFYDAARTCFLREAEASDWSEANAEVWIRDRALGWRDRNDPQCNAPMELVDQYLMPLGRSDFDATMRLANTQICAGYSVLVEMSVALPAGLVERCDRFFEAVEWDLEG